MNGLELVQTHGIGWFCDRYKPKDKEETLVLEHLKENEGVEKHFTHFLASLSLEVPDGGIFPNQREKVPKTALKARKKTIKQKQTICTIQHHRVT